MFGRRRQGGIEYAYDRVTGELVSARRAGRGWYRYYCPHCRYTIAKHGRLIQIPHFRHHRDAPRDCPLRAQAGYDIVKRYYELHHQALVRLRPSASAVFLTSAPDAAPNLPTQHAPVAERPFPPRTAAPQPTASTAARSFHSPTARSGSSDRNSFSSGISVVGWLSAGCVVAALLGLVGFVAALGAALTASSSNAAPSPTLIARPAVTGSPILVNTESGRLLADLLGVSIDWGLALTATPGALRPNPSPSTACSAAFTDRRATTAGGLLAGEHAQLMSYRSEGLFLVSIDLARDQALRAYLVQHHGPPRVSRGMDLWNVGSTVIQLRLRNDVQELRIYEQGRRTRYHNEVERRCRRR